MQKYHEPVLCGLPVQLVIQLSLFVKRSYPAVEAVTASYSTVLL